ncbi:acyltransferase [Deinococcus apachensis]|uniref:acyltransferase n=1 Tax=Deinococcus apachensis TaxID=309886 RepID=UPI000A0272A4|nr:acyltransferase [Deinococcus apachensis]
MQDPLGKLLIATVGSFQAASWLPSKFRVALLRAAGFDLHRSIHINSGVHFGRRNVTMRLGVFVNVGVYFSEAGRIYLGERVHLAPHVKILTDSHDIGSFEKRAGQKRVQDVRVERGSWVGAGSIILPGVTIAEGCVIAAGAVVTKSTEPNGLYAGVPAKRVRDLPT